MKGLGAMLLATALLLWAASDPALARGGSGRGGGGGHASAGHAAGARSGASHVNGGRASGRHSGHVNGGHGHSHVGAIFGASLFFPSWYFYPPAPAWYAYPLPPEYYYEDATAYAAPLAPAQYVEQGPAAAAQQPSYWYYCGESKTYYPYVEECPGGWQTVTPPAPSAPSAN